MRFLKAFVIGLFAQLCLCHCTAVQVQQGFHNLSKLGSEETIVLLSMCDGEQDFDDDDVDSCIRPVMRRVSPELNFVSAKQFREHLYPYFSPHTTPLTLEGYKNVLNKPEVYQRIFALKVRYLIILTKSATKTDWHGGIFCGAGYGGGGCLGLGWWDRKSEIGFAVWDLQEKSLSGTVQASAAGKGIMPALGLPIPIYSPATQSAVCGELGTRLAEFLSGQNSFQTSEQTWNPPSTRE